LFYNEQREISRVGAELKVFKKEYKLLDGNVGEMVERVGDGSIIKRFDKEPGLIKLNAVVACISSSSIGQLVAPMTTHGAISR